ncbi:MAG: glycosyltransferase family 87 protein [Sulfuritalea sp.]|nr:glycosyltransferase family 87 protein [Sulfuritalea sp.]
MGNPSEISRTPSRRWMLLGLAIFMGYLITVAVIHRDGRQAAAEGETPLLTDFTSLYAASMLVRQQAAVDLYRPREMYQASLLAAQAAYDGKLSEKQARAIGFHPWMYPPTFIPAAIPLAYLPYLFAWLAWLAVTSIPYLLAMRAILKDQSFWLIALAAPPVFYNIMYGQTGFLTAGLIGLGLVWLQPRPVLAGICIGLASVKPHFGLLIPIALICGAHWKAFWTAVMTVIVSAIAAGLLFGADSWFGFIGTLLSNMRGFEQGAYNWSVMPSVLGALHQAGLDLGWAWRGQILAAAVALAAVGWAWWSQPGRTSLPGLDAAILCLATLLAVPMVYLYDLMLLVPAIAWLWVDMRDRGYRKWELLLLTVCSAGLIGLREIGAAGPMVGVALNFALLYLAVSRRVEAKRRVAA